MEKLKVSDAAQRAGVTTSTIRRWAKDGKINSTRTACGDFEIEAESLMGYLAKQPIPQASLTQHVPPQESPEVQALRMTLAAFQASLERETATLERERKLSDDLRDECRRLQADVRSLQAEMRALLTGELQEVVSRWVRVQPEEKHTEQTKQPQQESQDTESLEEPEPKTDFGRQCYQLFKDGKSDEEISEALHKPLPNVRMALRRYRHST